MPLFNESSKQFYYLFHETRIYSFVQKSKLIKWYYVIRVVVTIPVDFPAACYQRQKIFIHNILTIKVSKTYLPNLLPEPMLK